MAWHLIDSVTIEKPVFGDPCNGCGVCCIAQVCDLGKELGDDQSCKALIRNPDRSVSCGLVVDPYRFTPESELVDWKFIDVQGGGHAGEDRLKKLNASLLGAGRGCDSDDAAVQALLSEAHAHQQLKLPNVTTV
ncbi:hypothetical protein [Pseudomonas sp. NPDC089569]|uniref:hypothetical protein n=1 Tax=Pseudomonas sp. NPDC089569 TaxID=3390722 RepID=UPI003CFC6394